MKENKYFCTGKAIENVFLSFRLGQLSFFISF